MADNLPTNTQPDVQPGMRHRPPQRTWRPTTALLGSVAAGAWAAGTDSFKVGLVGCGGRGTGAASDCVNAAPGVTLTAMGDLFADRLAGSRGHLVGLGDKVDVPEERCFVGFDAYRRVLDSGVDIVLLTTPPGFRPFHFQEAVAASKHCFLEKPGATDPAGVRTLMAASDAARERNLGVLSGTQYRHHEAYQQVMEQVHAGAIGELVAAQAYYNTGSLWLRRREEGQSDMEWQIRNWYYFTWLSGDHIVEQHVHNLDVMNWAMQAHPERCVSLGGRQVRTDPVFGEIYDHFATEYIYPGDRRVVSLCRQQDNTATRVSDRLVGTRGTANPAGRIEDLAGEPIFRYRGEATLGTSYVQEHTDFIASLREGRPLNEGHQLAEGSLTAIMARMSAYTGQEVSWEQALNSPLDLGPEDTQTFGEAPPAVVAMPGKTPLV